MHEGTLDSARALFAEALELRRALGDPLRVAHTQGDLASLYVLMDQPADALVLHQGQRRTYEQYLGATHPWVGEAEYNIGSTLLMLGRPLQARAHLESARTIWTDRHGPNYLDLAMVHVALHQFEITHGSIERAMGHALEARRIRDAHLPPDHVDVAEAEIVVGMANFFSGEFEDAVAAYRAAVAILRDQLGADAPNTALVRANLAEALLALGHRDEARDHVETAWEVLHATLPDHPASANAIKIRGLLARMAGDLDTSVAHLMHAQWLLESGGVQYPLEQGSVLLELSQTLAEQGRSGEANEMARRAEGVFTSIPGEFGRRGAFVARRLAQP